MVVPQCLPFASQAPTPPPVNKEAFYAPLLPLGVQHDYVGQGAKHSHAGRAKFPT